MLYKHTEACLLAVCSQRMRAHLNCINVVQIILNGISKEEFDNICQTKQEAVLIGTVNK